MHIERSNPTPGITKYNNASSVIIVHDLNYFQIDLDFIMGYWALLHRN